MQRVSDHVPVLPAEVLEALSPPPGGTVIDATIGGGGHALLVLAKLGESGRLLGLDRDPRAVELMRKALFGTSTTRQISVVSASFARVTEVAAAEGITAVDAILFDLGMSNDQLINGRRGFSFETDEPLDLRFDPTDAGLRPAAWLVARARRDELARIFTTYGEERYARRIAKHIERVRPRRSLETAAELRECVLEALPAPARRFGRRSVARVFQALRIATNAELDELESALPQVPALLRPGGRIAVIAFHSLEDRIVKRFFRRAALAGDLTIVTKKPLRPTDSEIRDNPRARSARLRVAERPRIPAESERETERDSRRSGRVRRIASAAAAHTGDTLPRRRNAPFPPLAPAPADIGRKPPNP